MPEQTHIHHWVIESSNGNSTSPGTCQTCEATGEFQNSIGGGVFNGRRIRTKDEIEEDEINGTDYC